MTSRQVPGAAEATAGELADALRILQCRVAQQQERLRNVQDEAFVLRLCLAEAGVLRLAAFDAQLHRLRFARARQKHPLGSAAGASLLQVLRTGELAAGLALAAGAPALAMLAGACRRTGNAAAEALPAVVAAFPRHVHVCGGMDAEKQRLSSAERFDPVGGTWSLLPSMSQRRSGAAGTAFRAGLAVCAGKADTVSCLSTAELFDPFGSAGRLDSATPIATAARVRCRRRSRRPLVHLRRL